VQYRAVQGRASQGRANEGSAVQDRAVGGHGAPAVSGSRKTRQRQGKRQNKARHCQTAHRDRRRLQHCLCAGTVQ
jgi:hypothetical protein